MPTTPKTWRVAFCGAGQIVQRSHIPTFQRIPGVEAVALCDVNQARAQQVARETNIPKTYTDYRVMLAEVKPDITVIATPNVFHKPMTMDALAAGSHVLCEKPLALTYADAVEMMESAKAKGLQLSVGTHYRWSPPMRAAKAHVDAGFFGEIYAARTVWHRRAGIPGFGSWFTNMDLAGGGALLDIGVHALDRALFLMNYPQPVTVSGATFAKFGPRGQGLGGWGSDISRADSGARFDVDDMAWAFVRFANGAVLQFQVSWAAHFAEQFVTEIYGSEGGAAVGSREGVELYTTLNGQQVKIQTEVPEDRLGSYTRLVENYMAKLNGDPSAQIVTPEQALTSVRIIDAIMRSAASGHEIDLTQQ